LFCRDIEAGLLPSTVKLRVCWKVVDDGQFQRPFYTRRTLPAVAQSVPADEASDEEGDGSASVIRQRAAARTAAGPRQLEEVVRRHAASPAEWLSRVRLNPEGRWYEQIHLDEAHEVWVISWLPGQGTGFHDHGGSAGAFAVVWGTLLEWRVAGPVQVEPVLVRAARVGGARSFGPATSPHDVRSAAAAAVAVSVHAYSPPPAMTRYGPNL